MLYFLYSLFFVMGSLYKFFFFLNGCLYHTLSSNLLSKVIEYVMFVQSLHVVSFLQLLVSSKNLDQDALSSFEVFETPPLHPQVHIEPWLSPSSCALEVHLVLEGNHKDVTVQE